LTIDSRPRRAAVAIIRDADKYLGIMRAAHIRAGGKICFPGGGIEENETEEQALIRELDEELGLEVRPIATVWRCVTARGVHINWMTAELVTNQIVIDPNEVEWCRWLTLKEFRSSPDLLESNADFFDALESGKIQID